MRRYSVNVDGRAFVIDVQEVARDSFRVSVEGREFDVHLASAEDVAEAAITPVIAASRPQPPAGPYRPPSTESLPPIPAAEPPKPPIVASEHGIVTTPMPGTVSSVLVEAGDHVSRGEVLVRLEAMKMINAIRAPHDGVVAEVLIEEGARVAYGAPLLRLAER